MHKYRCLLLTVLFTFLNTNLYSFKPSAPPPPENPHYSKPQPSAPPLPQEHQSDIIFVQIPNGECIKAHNFESPLSVIQKCKRRKVCDSSAFYVLAYGTDTFGEKEKKSKQPFANYGAAHHTTRNNPAVLFKTESTQTGRVQERERKPYANTHQQDRYNPRPTPKKQSPEQFKPGHPDDDLGKRIFGGVLTAIGLCFLFGK